MNRVLNRSVHPDVTAYIVRAGTDSRLGLSEEVVGRFSNEEEARRAFLALRLSPAYRHGWAEVMAVADSRRPMPLCWFGDPSPSATPVRPLNRKSPRTAQSRAQTDTQGEAMQTIEQERLPAPAADLGRPRRGRRAVAALVAVLAAASLALGAAAGSRNEDSSGDQPAPMWQVPAQPADGLN